MSDVVFYVSSVQLLIKCCIKFSIYISKLSELSIGLVADCNLKLFHKLSLLCSPEAASSLRRTSPRQLYNTPGTPLLQPQPRPPVTLSHPAGASQPAYRTFIFSCRIFQLTENLTRQRWRPLYLTLSGATVSHVDGSSLILPWFRKGEGLICCALTTVAPLDSRSAAVLNETYWSITCLVPEIGVYCSYSPLTTKEYK